MIKIEAVKSYRVACFSFCLLNILLLRKSKCPDVIHLTYSFISAIHNSLYEEIFIPTKCEDEVSCFQEQMEEHELLHYQIVGQIENSGYVGL